MRIHRLELTAFGPFPGTEVVDFDRLNDAGLFLLTGPTGSGKTSVLDAVCFALYGAVPGNRNAAKSFKSHHAAPATVPSVLLEVTVRGRRLRLRRQPAWTRPSRRARSGVVEETAKASVEEYVEGGWHVHSTRVDEVGHLVSSILGMNKDQFCQVVMLPQGEFQTFLTAGAKDRHDVLETLFRTHRFNAVERWLTDSRRALDAECRAVEHTMDRLLARVEEAFAGAPTAAKDVGHAADTHTHDQADEHDYAAMVERLQARREVVAAEAAAAAEAAVEASELAKEAQHELDSARALVDQQQRRQQAQNHWDELVALVPEVRRRDREVVLARAAAAFVPLLDLVAEAEVELDDATRTVDEATAAIRRPEADACPDLSSIEAVQALSDSRRRELARLTELVESQAEVERLMLDLAEVAAVLERSRAREAELVAATSAELAAVDEALLAARESRADARDGLYDVRERRIAGMAAQLAAELTPGTPCPVCGSVEHPQPATLARDHVSADDEAASRSRVEVAEDAVAQLEQRRERLHGESTVELESVRATVLTLQAQHAERSAATLARQSRIQAVVGDTSLDEQIAVVSEQVESADALVSAMRAASDAAVTLRTTVDRLDRLVADSVFATVQEVRDAVRSPADIASAEALNRTHTTERAVVEKMLADPALHRAAQTPAPDIEQLVRTTDARVGRAAAANARADRLEEAAVRLESLIGDVHGQLARWQPLRGRRDLTEQVAQLVAGTAKDNLSKIRLSHYVLAARLAQVVAAANVRLRGICAGRYELEHTLQRGVGDARGGLGLRVMDTYTGRLRDPATLSGGETFYVSLALALGLADLVNNEIGGTELSTLFVDEGFGSLDADTLDEVVGELDALRSGGRSVGLVSHLAELRMRVPTQLSVVRSRKGSRLDDS